MKDILASFCRIFGTPRQIILDIIALRNIYFLILIKGSCGNMQTVFLVRHGESLSNIGKATISPRSVRLTPVGAAQSLSVAEFLRSRASLDLIVTSPYQRTKQTAAPTKWMFHYVPEEEWDVQEFTYLSLIHKWSTVKNRQPKVLKYWQLCDPQFVDGPGAESFEEFIIRVKQAIKKLKEAKHQTIALFSHEQFINAMIWLLDHKSAVMTPRAMLDFRLFLKRHSIPNGTIVELTYDEKQDEWSYKFITEHLHEPEEQDRQEDTQRELALSR